MQRLDWDDLRLFLAIARAGTLVGAGRLLDLDHTTLSRRLSGLEERLSIKLFERAGRRLKINAAGQQLRKTAEKLESNLFADLAAMRTAMSSRSGVVRIGAPEGLGIGYLARKIGGIAERYPDITIELVALPQRYSLAAREADIVITLDRPTSGNQVVRRLTDYKLGFFASRDYLREFGVPERVEDLQHHRLCGYIQSLLHTRELDYLRFGSVELTAQLCSTSVIAQRDVVASGSAVGILPNFIAAEMPDVLVPIVDHEHLTRRYWLTIHEDFRDIVRIKLISREIFKNVKQDKSLFCGS